MVLATFTPGPFIIGIALFNGFCIGLETEEYVGYMEEEDTMVPFDRTTAWVLSLGPVRVSVFKIR